MIHIIYYIYIYISFAPIPLSDFNSKNKQHVSEVIQSIATWHMDILFQCLIPHQYAKRVQVLLGVVEGRKECPHPIEPSQWIFQTKEIDIDGEAILKKTRMCSLQEIQQQFTGVSGIRYKRTIILFPKLGKMRFEFITGHPQKKIM